MKQDLGARGAGGVGAGALSARRRVAAAVRALGAAAVVCAASLAHAAPGVPCAFYGVAAPLPLDAALATEVASTGARAVRVEMVAGAGGTFDDAQLAGYDTLFDTLEAAGLTPIGVLGTLVVPTTQAEWNDDADGDGNNAFVEEFATASAGLVERFATRVSRWEVWGGPNCWTSPDYLTNPQGAGCTYLLPRVFGRMMSEVYLRARVLVDVGAISFTAGGLATDDSGPFYTAETYLDELYAQPMWDDLEADTGRRYPWDLLGVQLYLAQATQVDEGTISDHLDAIRTIVAARTDASSFAITEVGWSSLTVGEDLQAANLSTTFDALASRDDVASASWSLYRDIPPSDLYYGLVSETGEAKAAAEAMQAAAEGCTPGEDPGGEGGGTSVSGSGPSGGGFSTTGGGTAPPLGGPRGENSCSCRAAGSGARSWGAGASILMLGGVMAARRRRRSPEARGRRVTP